MKQAKQRRLNDYSTFHRCFERLLQLSEEHALRRKSALQDTWKVYWVPSIASSMPMKLETHVVKVTS